MNPVLVYQAKRIFKELSDEERLEVMNDYCKVCGCDNPNCQCWNDE